MESFKCVPRPTYLMEVSFWVRVSKGGWAVTCSCSCVLACVHGAWWRCEQQRGVNDCCAKSWPHVAFHAFSQKAFEVWHSPSDLTCGLCLQWNNSQIYWLLEIDVNTNLFAIYLRPLGCLCSFTALQQRLGIQGCLSRPVHVKVDKRKRNEERFHNTTQYVDVAQLGEMLTLSKAAETRNKCGLKMTFWVSLFALIHEHRRYFPKLCACLSVTQHCGVAYCLVIVNRPNVHFRLMGKQLLCCSWCWHLFHSFSVKFLGMSSGLSDQIMWRLYRFERSEME